ncbi:MAG: 1-acyl-sn-glycerol-3-phosphate acyltransferase [Clostridia bacterium]|nr:1-acyl-sn-glycerol-3-phosphate acyltransferase [Clostridia bacterium]
MARKKHVKWRHKPIFALARLVGFFMALRYGYKKNVYPLKKKQYFILSNHQTLLDPPLLAFNFRAPVYFIASDTLWNGTFVSKLLQFCFAPIKKRKAMTDVACIRTCLRVAKEGGNIALFPEGNRSWADTPLYIDPAICKFVRMLKLPLLLHRFEGGFGVDPRWCGSLRRGPFKGYVAKELSTEEIDRMSDEELYEVIVKTLYVEDCKSGNLYKSKRRAEFLERLLFVCPCCHSLSTLRSEGNQIHCSHCELSVTYEENLSLSSERPDFPFHTLSEWASFQKQTVKNLKDKKESVSLCDENVRLYDKTQEKRALMEEGTMTLTEKALSLGSFSVPTADITGATVVGGTQLVINTDEKSYSFFGSKRFNPIKYMLFFHILDTKMQDDKYYGLSD